MAGGGDRRGSRAQPDPARFRVPWLAVSLAATFGFYGLARKAVDVNSLHGLLIESAILVPVAIFMIASGRSGPVSRESFGILSLSGVITAVPLLCFGAALR